MTRAGRLPPGQEARGTRNRSPGAGRDRPLGQARVTTATEACRPQPSGRLGVVGVAGARRPPGPAWPGPPRRRPGAARARRGPSRSAQARPPARRRATAAPVRRATPGPGSASTRVSVESRHAPGQRPEHRRRAGPGRPRRRRSATPPDRGPASPARLRRPQQQRKEAAALSRRRAGVDPRAAGRQRSTAAPAGLVQSADQPSESPARARGPSAPRWRGPVPWPREAVPAGPGCPSGPAAPPGRDPEGRPRRHRPEPAPGPDRGLRRPPTGTSSHR